MDRTLFKSSKSEGKHLNSQQKKAVIYTDGPSVILAGAGSGKTRILIFKVLHLIRNLKVDPQSILMITFTNKAAGEMKERMGLRKLGYIGTFHSFCSRMLRIDGEFIGIRRNYVIYNENDQLDLIKNIVKTLEHRRHTPSYFLNRISTAKNNLIESDRYLDLFSDYSATEVAVVYDLYQKKLKKNNALDFDDLVMKTVQLFLKNPPILDKYQDKYRYILVDEFQDTNSAQYLLTKLLGEKYKNLTVVGDFSQSIYSWRGADIRNLEKFNEDFPTAKVYHLEQNYRSTQKILDFAHKVISKNQTHPILHLFTKNDQGDDVMNFEAENEEYEAIYVANQIKDMVKNNNYSLFAVLYRTNAQSRVVEEAFLHYGIPYVFIGGTRFYERKEIRDVLSYLRLFANPDDEVAKERIMKIGKKRWNIFKKFYQKEIKLINKKTTNELLDEIFQASGYLTLYNSEDEEDFSRLENIKELRSVAMNFPKLQDFLEQVALVESEYFEGEKKIKDHTGVRIMTLHQAKGLEFPYVFIIGVEEGILPHSRSIDDYFQLEEERRLFYVGITRAKEKLFITYTRYRSIFGRRGETIKSRFLGEEVIDW